jgi:Xaa-Pro aminopeptidase
MSINEKVEALRVLMLEKKLDAYIIPSTDPHISEYVADRWKSKAWISGFTGSVATFVITKDNSGLWVDSRYWLQAENELKDTEIKVFRQGDTGVLTYIEWLCQKLEAGKVVGFDGKVVTQSLANQWEKDFAVMKIKINLDYDLIDSIWIDRPQIPLNKIFLQDIKFAGISRKDKLEQIRLKMEKMNCFYHIIATLDDIGWLFNIRGRDVEYNPVAYCYAVITMENAELYIYPEKLDYEVKKILENDGIIIKNYIEIENSIRNFDTSKQVYIDANRINAYLYNCIPPECNILSGLNFSTSLKSIKNETELSGVRNVMKRDCVALIKYIYWLKQNLGKEKITEMSSSAKIREIRAEDEYFFGESFGAISGYKGNGAIVHYSSTPETNVELKQDGFYLLDTGGQYFDGTTDITRIFHLGTPTEEEMTDYTLVLKGHINLNLAVFPVNTRGSQLDILARNFLWQNMMNYGHGTGHGVGCFMNVHEGPQSIRMEENSTVLQPGMITSNEPGLYRKDKYGIRIENLVNVVEAGETEFGKFLKFEVLTLCPIDKKAINKDLLNDQEINWLNEYHQRVYNESADLLNGEILNWLAEATSPI